MKIVHISDSHSHHRELYPLPDADVIVHSGDFTFAGSQEETIDFLRWFCDLPYAYKLFIAGNHDMCMYGVKSLDGLPDNVHYLHNDGFEIGDKKFYGISMFMEDCMSGAENQFLRNIPKDTDVLITHMPPRGICDMADYGKGLEHRGDKVLAERIESINLVCHLFGHEHDAYGFMTISKTFFSNACVVDSQYHLVNNPVLIELR